MKTKQKIKVERALLGDKKTKLELLYGLVDGCWAKIQHSNTK